MPSTPRKVKAGKGIDSDSEDSDIPSLIPCSSDDEDSEVEELLRKPANKAKGKGKTALKPKNNAECADMWYKLSKDEKEKHIHVMKVYLLSPFLFGQVYQEDKWINWAYESGLLPSKSSFEIKGLEEKHFDGVDLIETAFNKLADNALRKNKDGLVKTLDIIGSSGLSMSQHLDKAITCAESFLAFTNLREKIKLKPGTNKKQGDVALLLAHYQVSDHIKQLADGVNLVETFNKKCKDEEDLTATKKKEGNDAFSKGKYKSAISVYSNALHLSPYNHVLYGNRAQSYLKTQDLWCALTDGRRAVVLRAEWHKAQYRYSQAFFELGFVARAKETNKAARKICSERKDLETQFERFEKGNHPPNEGKGKAAENKKGAKQSKMPDDLPDLVDANSSDTSRNSDDDYGPPDLVDVEEEASTDSTHDESEDQNAADSSDGYESDDSSAQKKTTLVSAQPKERKISKKVKKGLREAVQDKVKQEEKAKREEREKKMAERAAKKEIKKIGKRSKKAKPAQLNQSGDSDRKREFMAYLKQGSKAILEKKCMLAVRNYRDAMNLLEEHDFQFQVFDMKEIDFVILLYGFGAAYLELGGHEELLEAKKQFDIILVKHKNVDFPLAFLGTGRVFYKQNRFTEALEPLEEGLALVNKLCEALAGYRWPGSSVEIEESKPAKLLSAIETLIRICRHPPRPDAICRYPDCPNKSQIYLTDSDYKGYIRLICDEDCKVEFHPVCWKKQKSTQEEKAGDKDFLEDACMTPDCAGTVVDIQIFDADGLKTEFKHEKLNAKVEAKPKAAKQNKIKPSGIAAKQKMKKGKDDLKIEDASSTDGGEEKELATTPSVPAPLAAQKEEKPLSKEIKIHIQLEKVVHAPSDTSTSMHAGEGVFILKKEDDEEPTKGGGKAKTKKKKLKNTQTLDEFLKDRGGQQTFRPGYLETTDELDEITIPKGKFDFVPPPPGWSQHEMEAPFAIPPHLHGDAAMLEASYRDGFNMFSTPSLMVPQSELQPQIDLQAVADYVSSMLQEILRVNGPLELADPNITQPLSMLPDNYQGIIHSAGGLRPILEQSGKKFLFQGNKVMLPEDKEFEDLVQTLKPQTDNPFLERINGANDAKLGKSIWDFDRNESGAEGMYFRPSSPLSCNSTSPTLFNPNAKEFVPSASQTDLLCNSSSGTSLTSDISTLKEAELVDGEIQQDDTITEEPEQISNESKVEGPTISNVGTVENEPISKVNKVENETSLKESKVENETILNEGKVENEPISKVSKTENVVENVNEAGDMKTTNGTQKEIIMKASTTAVAVKAKSLSVVNGKNFEDSACDLALATTAVALVKERVAVAPVVNEGAIQAQTSHKRPSTSDPVITSKAKSIQTQPNVKSKGVGTDPIPERYKAEYQRATAEKDALQARLQEYTDRHNALLNKNTAEIDKVKKKLTDALQEKEKYSKDLQDVKQKNLEDIRKLRQQCEDKEEKIKVLSKKLLQDADDKSSAINSLKKELAACKGQFTSEKDSWNKERSEKEELLKSVKLQHQQQQSRAQDAEIKLLELRRDVGLRFLERAYQESHITINNLIQAVNARIAGPKVEELITTWRNYTVECHQRVVQCKATFNEQIELLKNGRTLANVPQLTIPGPPPYPAIPVLQSLVPGQQQNQSQPQPPVESSTPAVSRPADPPLSNAAAVAPTGVPAAGATPAGSTAAVNGDQANDAVRAAATPAPPNAAAAAAAASTAAANVADKARPSNSFEKIMLRLSTMYPNFTRLELTGFIKEVRHNKHGSLTGLSLEDIVTSVSELVEQKKKAGLLRAAPSPATNSPTTPRSTKPVALPQKTQSAQPVQVVKPFAPEVSKAVIGSGSYEEDPCVICHDDMNTSSDIVTLECGHKYHSQCIRKWLLGEQSTCPTCRVHALLPDEFPRLK